MEWTDDTIGRLKSLWIEGLSTAEIGRRMGVSKNAVVGKAHRLLLAPRPSPIRRELHNGASARALPPRRVVGPTLPSLAADLPVPKYGAFRLPTADGKPDEGAVRESGDPKNVLRPVSRPLRAEAFGGRRTLACCWPIGEPGTRSFRFCDDASLAGKPYCAAHAAIAYVKVRDRRDDAA